LLLAALLVQEAPAAPLRAQASVVMVHAQTGEGGPRRQGSGVVIAPGRVVTNAHVVGGDRVVTVSRGAESWTATRLQTEAGLDLCLLAVPGLPLPSAEAVAEEPRVGSPVFAFGHPGGRGLTVTAGQVVAIWQHPAGRLIQSDAPTHPGSSGGGLFDAEGHLLGLTTFTFPGNPRLNFSVPVRWVQGLASRGQEPSTPAFNQAADFLTVMAEEARNWPAWERLARAWTETQPADPDAWFALGLVLDRQARREAEGGGEAHLRPAIQAYERALALRPEAKAWNNLGVAWDSENRFEEAERAYLGALALQPGYGTAWLNLGNTRFNAGRFQEAAEAYGRGLDLQPDEVGGWIRLAHCHRRLRHWHEALGAFQTALRYRPLSGELWLQCGLLHLRLNQREAAEAVLAKLNDLEPGLAPRLEKALARR
jgi:Flp pilus assembly protein TadD